MSIDVYGPQHTPQHIPTILQIPGTVEKIDEFMGEKGLKAYHDALFQSSEAMQYIMGNVKGMLSRSESADNVLENLSQKTNLEIKIKFRKGIKLFLGKQDLDDQIEKLNRSTSTMRTLQWDRHAISQIEQTGNAKLMKRFGHSLRQLQFNSDRLHKAIAWGWSSGCHSTHEVKLYLEDRVIAYSSRASSLKAPPISFKLIFTSGGISDNNSVWYYSEVEATDSDEQYEEDENTRLLRKQQAPPQAPRVAFSDLPTATPLLSTEVVHDLCVKITIAKRKEEAIRFYLHGQNKLHWRRSQT
ncbi:hypothetical protein MMC17_005240 [Xylographa soralifera]|nr:hypothetical protein [Xylographa soralifera]